MSALIQFFSEGVTYHLKHEEDVQNWLLDVIRQEKLDRVVVDLLEEETGVGRLGEQAGEAVVSVADTGPGLPDEVLSRLFREEVTTKCSETGTGLGLSIARGIVTAHGGSIGVGEGPGGVVEMALPA